MSATRAARRKQQGASPARKGPDERAPPAPERKLAVRPQERRNGAAEKGPIRQLPDYAAGYLFIQFFWFFLTLFVFGRPPVFFFFFQNQKVSFVFLDDDDKKCPRAFVPPGQPRKKRQNAGGIALVRGS